MLATGFLTEERFRAGHAVCVTIAAVTLARRTTAWPGGNRRLHIPFARVRIISMFRSVFSRLATLALLLGLVVVALPCLAQQESRGRKYKAPPPTAKIVISVVREGTGKPVANAAVIFTLTTEKGNMELKTDYEGKAIIDVLPIGSGCRLQVIARGFQTYGEDFQIDRPEIAKEIRLKRPGEQYSIYNSQAGAAAAGAEESAPVPSSAAQPR